MKSTITTTPYPFGTAIGYHVDTEFIPRGEYKRTEFDDFKDNAHLHNRGWLGSRAEIWVNNPDNVQIREGRGIKKICDRCYLVTDKALKELEAKYSIATDWYTIKNNNTDVAKDSFKLNDQCKK